MNKNNKLLVLFILGINLVFVLPYLCFAAASSIAVTATVLESTSFDATRAPLSFDVPVVSKVVIPTPITATMTTNTFPWTVRIYTDNANAYTGSGSPAGLVGVSNPKESIPLKVWCGNYGPGDSYPDISNATYWASNWREVPDQSAMTDSSSTWQQLAYTNSEKDASMGDSFDVYIAADFVGASAQTYSGTLILEFLNPDQGASSSRSVTINVSATVPEYTNFSVIAPAAVLNFGSFLPDKVLFPLPVSVYVDTNALPWAVRVYTVNSGIYTGSGDPSGLVGVGDTSVSVPLKIWCANFGPSSTPPDIDTGNFWKDNWFRIPDYAEMDSDPYSWRRLAYRTTDKNATLDKPFYAYLAADFRSAPAQTYNGNIVFEYLNQ